MDSRVAPSMPPRRMHPALGLKSASLSPFWSLTCLALPSLSWPAARLLPLLSSLTPAASADASAPCIRGHHVLLGRARCVACPSAWSRAGWVPPFIAVHVFAVTNFADFPAMQGASSEPSLAAAQLQDSADSSSWRIRLHPRMSECAHGLKPHTWLRWLRAVSASMQTSVGHSFATNRTYLMLPPFALMPRASARMTLLGRGPQNIHWT